MTAMRANPPWANRLLNENWNPILSEIGKPTWMPKLADGSGRRKTFAELGCGHYGCVFATSEPGVVFKISTDPSEVEFVKAAMKFGEWPAGIVRYHAVLDVQGSHRGRSAFVVWREEAFDVGSLGPGPDPHAERAHRSYHNAYLNVARALRDMSTRPAWGSQLAGAGRYEEWAHRNVIWEDGSPHQARGFAQYRGSQRIAAGLRICQIAFELMEHTNYAPDVGSALGFYLDHKILLADVHMNNIGRVMRDDGYGPEASIVITDPGHAVFLVTP